MAKNDEEWKQHKDFFQRQALGPKESDEVRQDARDVLVDMSKDD